MKPIVNHGCLATGVDGWVDGFTGAPTTDAVTAPRILHSRKVVEVCICRVRNPTIPMLCNTRTLAPGEA